MVSTNARRTSTSRRIIEGFHRTKAYLTKVVILLTIVIFAIAATITYYATLKFSNQFVIEILIVPSILTILSVIASFTFSPRFLFVLATLLGVDTGAVLRYFLVSG